MPRAPFEQIASLVDEVWARADFVMKNRHLIAPFIPAMRVIEARVAATASVVEEHGWTLDEYEDEEASRWRQANKPG